MAFEVNENGLISKPQNGIAFTTQTGELLRSEAVTEIISHHPGFLVRWGTTIFFFMLISILFISWLIQYPDLIYSNAKLTSTNAPKEIICNTDGKLVKLNITEGQAVKAGDLLGFIESTASQPEVIELSQRLDSSIKMLENSKPEALASLFAKRFSCLGELQISYQTFITALQHYNDYLVNGFYSKRKAFLQNDISSLKRMKDKIVTQRGMTNEESKLAKESFEMNEILFKEKVISAEEYRQAKSALINKQKEIDQLNHDIVQQQQTFEQALQTLKSMVDDWKKKYLFIAPMNGKVSFSSIIQENQQMKAGQQICFINPGNSSYYAEMYIPQANFGKVKNGANVLLKFPAYPSQEFGSLQGKIDFISRIPTDSGYLAKVVLPQGLITNYKQNIQYREGLNANAEIITKDMRLLERLYYSIIKATSKNR
ncbi:MAG: HlyD family efflux transporter periplasmic adaptor subunit [Niabella sp.]